MLAALSGLWRHTRGSVAPIVAVAMLMIPPMTAAVVDSAHAWNAKRTLQDALDAALLAVARADAESSTEINAIAGHYLDSNLAHRYGATLTQVTIKRVAEGHYTGTVSANVKTYFAGVFGIDHIAAGVDAEVKVSKSKLEVVLSLDTTGSMSGARITALKAAAHDFVDEMLDGEDIKIGIVPFARYVNIGMDNRNAPGFAIPNDSETCRMEMREKRINYRNCRTIHRSKTCYNDGVPFHCEWDDHECDYDTVMAEEEVCDRNKWKGCVGSRPDAWKTRDDNNPTYRIPGIMNESCGTPLVTMTDNRGPLISTIASLDIGEETYLPVGLSMGWATLSHRIPFVQGTNPASAPRELMRALVLMTDGLNTVSIYPSHNFTGHHEDDDTDTANAVTADLCRNIKADGVILFTIAFDVTDATVKSLLSTCATAPNFAFDAQGSGGLNKAFEDIAAALSRLRLSE